MAPDTPRPDALSRRSFLGAGLAAAGGLVVASALPESAAGAASYPVGAFVLSSDLYASSQPQRFVFVLEQGSPDGIRFVSGPAAKIRFRSLGGRWTPTVPAPLDRAGLPKGRGVYVTTPVLDEAGAWRAEASVAGKKVKFALQVNAQATAPVVGQAAPRAASPTTADTLGVNPICTRQPACPLHTQSLSTVIGAGRPVAALFATPARCQSQYCGPVLDELLRLEAPYADRVDFVHIEIYKSLTGTDLVPTVDAWGLASEPWLFGIDATGTIKSRIDGAFGGKEMKTLLDGLVQ
jgi:hypothetical protein